MKVIILIRYNKSHDANVTILIIRIRSQYSDHFVCQIPICVKNLFTILYAKRQTISVFTVQCRSGLITSFVRLKISSMSSSYL